jgi:hypothetical protein
LIARSLPILLGLCAWAPAPRALAQAGSDPTAAALFRSGRDLVRKGEWERGCAELRAALARYEAASTVLNVARCEDHFGRVASAWALYQRGVVLARDEPGAGRRQALTRIAAEGIAATEPRLARLRVELASAPKGLRVEQEGRPLPVGQAVPLDPGSHRIIATAPGYDPLIREVELEEGKLTTLALELSRAPAPDAAMRAPRPPTGSGSKPPPEKTVAPAAEPSPDGGVPTWAWISGGVGLALAGAAVGFALDAKSAADGLARKCGEDLVCDEDPSFDPESTNARKNRSLALAVGLGGAGAFALGASLYGILTAPRAASSGAVRPDLRVGSGSVWLGAQLSL